MADGQRKSSNQYSKDDEDKNRTWVWVVTLVLLFGMFCGILIPFVLEYSAPYFSWRWEDPVCPVMMEEEKIDCYPEDPTPNWYKCLKRGCCWRQSTTRAPSCFMALNTGYNLEGEPRKTVSGYQFDLFRRITPRVYGGEIWRLRLDIEMQTNERLRVKFYDPGWKRYEPPITLPLTTTIAQFPVYAVDYTKEPFTLQIKRRVTDQVVFNTSLGGFYFADQYITMSARLPSENIYGLGEHRHDNFQHMLDKTQKNLDTWHVWAMFARNAFPDDLGQNLYGQFPYYMVVENDGNAHGVLLVNSNAMEATLTPLPSITYRTTGGVLDFWFFFGPTPENVAEQYGVVNVLYTDAQFADNDYLDQHLEFTLASQFSNLNDYVENILHRYGYHAVLVFNPGIAVDAYIQYEPYQEGIRLNAFITRPDNETVLEGESWPGWVAYPDFDSSAGQAFYKDEVKKFYSLVKFDGMWLKSNEPDNFRHGARYSCWRNDWNYPVYVPRYMHDRRMWDRTICMDSTQSSDRHYNLHSMYGHQMAVTAHDAYRDAEPGKRGIIITRSAFPGTGAYAGHWLGDNMATWADLHHSLIGVLEFGLFGIPYVGANICGYFGEAYEQMCLRWHQLGMFYPFARNHNVRDELDQDPMADRFSLDFRIAVKKAIETRYIFLPYLYTLFHHAHVNGSTVIRSLVGQFPNDPNTWDIDRQLMWGDAIMAAPVLDVDTVKVNAYFPDVRWYDYWTGFPLARTSQRRYVSVDAPFDHIPIYIKGGTVIPTQWFSQSTVYARYMGMGLIIALPDYDYSNGMAIGDLFWDDGESRNTYEYQNDIFARIEATEDRISYVADRRGYDDPYLPIIQNITMLGVRKDVWQVFVDHQQLQPWQVELTDTLYNLKTMVLYNIDIAINEDHDIDIRYI
uniref:Maltase n=1 Tax=Saccoglossus kowalevskii TaxID=10224 RepID=A0ABM0N1B6_SACKO|nr:PREDICTED: maltase-glucoamylase, intestinal-like [Saccoglossus kowalevskii]